MSPTLIMAGVQATLRAAQAGADLRGRHARDRKVFLPNLRLPPGDREDQLNTFIRTHPEFLPCSPALSKVWNPEGGWVAARDRVDFEEAYAAMLEHEAMLELTPERRPNREAEHEAKMRAAGRLVEQWREDRKPPTALVRCALTLVDVALEFLTANPSLFGMSGRGEQLVVTLAANLGELTPDAAEEWGARSELADRLVAIFLRAGLSMLGHDGSVRLRDEDVAHMVAGVMAPVLQALPERAYDQFQFQQRVETWSGPVAQAAFRVLCGHTALPVGRDAGQCRAFAAVTGGLWRELREAPGPLVDAFSEWGVIRLYEAGLALAAVRPALFCGDEATEVRRFGDWLRWAGRAFDDYPCCQGPFAAGLVASLLESVGHHTPAGRQEGTADTWDMRAGEVLRQLLKGLTGILQAEPPDRPGAFLLLTDRDLIELIRRLVTPMAGTPGMLAVRSGECEQIVAGIAEAMALDEHLLLTADQWLALAGDLAVQAAANPGRLFVITRDGGAKGPATEVIQFILRTANRHWSASGSPDAGGRVLLFGEVLRRIIGSAVGALGGNLAGLGKNPSVVETLLGRLLDQAAGSPERVGSVNFAAAFERFVGAAFAKGSLPSSQQIARVLSA